jgi:uncharacterized membrane protein
MAGSKVFSGPPSNKATASTLAAAATTLFWTIAAHTFWKSMNVADLTLYISTSTVLLTAIVGFAVPESAAYTDHSKKRLVTQAAAQDGASTIPAIMSAIKDLEAKVQWSQQLDKAMADRLGIAPPPAISADGPTSDAGSILTQPQ